MDNQIAGQRTMQQPTVQARSKEEEKISLPNKEVSPVGGVSVSKLNEQEIRSADILKPTVSPREEVPISQELREVGVEQGVDTKPEVPYVVQHAGGRDLDAEAAMQIPALSEEKKLKISYAQADHLDKQHPIKDSIKWLALFIKRQWEKVNTAKQRKEQVI